ncbi:glycosyltransferase family 4 protein [Spelaeicoccus albus]|uniref:Glycosyltransferase involved in cell wall biosynthesis n=1 Tax=Spelaeicoccus albus TaxID=1280376 RepID=A0A7Z0IIW6_9MICO|nr:glycosyltransferase family 1 protein [Spelaeicoccus albus]NYI68899.1 glycosyltransferase involved in cell wall biosynthesis [Spelaeicoccus albus]
MKIFFDARFTRTRHHDGISRYGSNLLAALSELAPVTGIIHDDAQRALLPTGVPYVKLISPMSPGEPALPAALNRLGADVVFSPMQVMSSFGRKYKLILTLHDLIYYRHPEPPHDLPVAVRAAWRLYHKAYWPQRRLLNRADAIAAVSETTAGMIADHKLTKRPVHVIGNAADPPTDLPPLTNRHDAKSLVYMGAYLPYKNVETLIRSLEFLPGYTLHLSSRIEPYREAQLRELVPNGATVQFHHGVTDDEYHDLLDHATALVSASLDEGFGLPLVEAMSRRTPIVVSDLPIFHEIGDEKALYFPPTDAAALARQVRSLEDPGDWEARATAGPSRAATFSWSRSARTLLTVMEDLCGESAGSPRL